MNIYMNNNSGDYKYYIINNNKKYYFKNFENYLKKIENKIINLLFQ